MNEQEKDGWFYRPVYLDGPGIPILWQPVMRDGVLTVERVEQPRLCEITGIPLAYRTEEWGG